MRRISIPVVLALSLWVPGLPASGALAEAPRSEATVVAVEGQDVVLDVGADRLKKGAVLTLYRSVQLQHPLTGATLEDRFVNGKLQVVQVSGLLSIARLVGPPDRTPVPGDSATLPRIEKPAPRKPSPVVSESRKGNVRRAALVPEACPPDKLPRCHLLAVWQEALGQAPRARIQLLKRHLKKYPRSPYVSWVEQEIRRFSTPTSSRAVASDERQLARAVRNLVRVEPMERASAGFPLELGVYMPPESRVRGVRLHLREDPELGAYDALTIQLDERGHGRLAIPASFVRDPGFVFFVTVVLRDNREVTVLGSAKEPARCQVDPAPGGPARSGRSRLSARLEYVSFDGFSGRDAYALYEADYQVLTTLVRLPSLRLGYGHVRGQGGSLAALDERREDPEEAAYTYGHLGVELALLENLALLPRVGLGLGQDVDSPSQSAVRMGWQLLLRLGRVDGTHLLLGGQRTPKIGQLAFVGLRLSVLERFPIGFEVHVTDQPISADLAVRTVFEVGYAPADHFSLALRSSYQGRTIDHAGPGLGLAANLDW